MSFSKTIEIARIECMFLYLCVALDTMLSSFVCVCACVCVCVCVCVCMLLCRVMLVMPCMGNLYTSPYDVHRTYYTPCPRNILYARIVVCVSVGGCVKRPGRLIMVVYLPTGRKQIWRLSTG